MAAGTWRPFFPGLNVLKFITCKYTVLDGVVNNTFINAMVYTRVLTKQTDYWKECLSLFNELCISSVYNAVYYIAIVCIFPAPLHFRHSQTTEKSKSAKALCS